MDEYINFIIENFRYDSYPKADRALKMHYETTFGIFDHRSSTLQGKRPFSSQAFHPGVDAGGLYAFDHLADSFLDDEVGDMMQIGFDVYCTLTPDQMNRLHAKLNVRRKRKAEEAEQRAREEERRIQQLLNGGQKNQSPGVNARAMFGNQ